MHTHSHPRHSHGRVYLFNVMVTSTWRAKLSEYALDPYLKLTHGKLDSTGGYGLLPSKQHPVNTVLFLSPEKCSGKMAAAMQPQRLPITTRPIAPRRGWAGGLRRLAQSSRATQHSTAAPIAPSDTELDEPKTKSTRLLGEQRADAWAFGCVLASLALHQKRAKDGSSKVGLNGSPRRGPEPPPSWYMSSAEQKYG